MKKYTFLLFLSILSLFSAPVFGQAAFTADKFTGCAPLIVQFTDQSTCTPPCGWSWTFGNGNTSTLQSPSAQYNSPGTYSVTLSINGGSTSTKTITVFKSPVATFSINDDTTCIGSFIKFTSTSTPGSTSIIKYIWSFGDGTKDSTSGNFVSHSYTLNGVFSINLVIVDANNCLSGSSQNTRVYVIPPPVPKFLMTPASTCTFPTTVIFTNQTSPPATSYIWTFGDTVSGSSNISLLPNPTHTYTTTGQYTVVLTTLTGTCSTKDSLIFYAQPIVANFSTGSDTVCLNTAVLFNNTSNPPPNTALWNFGDPTSGTRDTSTLISPSHLYGNPGTYSVSMAVSNGCPDSKTKTIVVVPPPVYSITTADDSNYCKPPATIHFQISPSATSWQWYFADTLIGFKDSIVNPNNDYAFTGYGHYSIRLIGIDIYGCRDTVTKLNYINIVAPSINITTPADSGCSGKLFQFNTSTILAPGDTINKYYWNFGDGSPLDSTSGLASIGHTYNSCGIDTLSLIIKTTKGCSDTVTQNGWVRTGQRPAAGFKWTPDTICYGYPVYFTDTSKAKGCPITGREWSFLANDSTPNTSFPDTGKYSVWLAVYSYGCADTMFKDSIIMVLPPKPIISFITPTCANHNIIQFADSSHGADSLVWDFGDSTPKDTTNNLNPIHTYGSPGSYYVKLTAFNNSVNLPSGCSYTDSVKVFITAPLAVILAPAQGCHPYVATFDGRNSNDADSVRWDFGDPASGIFNTSTSILDTHTYRVPGTYSITLTVYDMYGCPSDTTFNFHCIGPITSFSAPLLKGCRPFTDTLISTSIPEGSPVTQYFWNFNVPFMTDTATSYSDTIAHTFGQNGFYTVMVVAIDTNGCRDTSIINNYIEVTFPAPQFTNIDTFICNNTITPFAVNANGTGPFTYHWNFGDGQPDTVISNSPFGTSIVTHSYVNNHTVPKLTVTVTDANGCDSTITQNITVLRPSAIFTSTQTHNCINTVPNYNTPMGDSITSWFWQVAGPYGYTNSSASANPSFGFTVPGTYYTTLTVTNPGCTDTYTDNGTIRPGPIAYITYDTLTHCPPARIVFTSHLLNSQKYDHINWDFGNGSSGITNWPDSTITYVYHGAGSFTPSAQIAFLLPNGSSCNVVDSNFYPDVVVVSSMSVNVTQDSIVIKEDHQDTLTSVLTPGTSSPPYIYSWNSNQGATLPNYNTTSAIYTAKENDNMVVLTVQDVNGCEAYDTVFIEVKLCEVNLKIPNVFTPNGDTLNETYYITDLCDYSGFSVTIYNRWGNVVYTSSDFGFHWNGKDNSGKECPEGVYYYIINGKRQKLYGYIHVIRE